MPARNSRLSIHADSETRYRGEKKMIQIDNRWENSRERSAISFYEPARLSYFY